MKCGFAPLMGPDPKLARFIQLVLQIFSSDFVRVPKRRHDVEKNSGVAQADSPEKTFFSFFLSPS